MRYFGGKQRVAARLAEVLRPAAFWDFCRVKSRDGHAVFVSEYRAPDDALLVLEVNSRLDIRTKDGSQPARTERLYSI